MKLRMGQASQHLRGAGGAEGSHSAPCRWGGCAPTWWSVQNTHLPICTQAERTLLRRTPYEAPSTCRSCLSQLG